MLTQLQKRNKTRKRRVLRVRKKLKGNAEKPRLSVNKSNRHITAQLIDDDKGVTIVSSGSLTKENKKSKHNRKSKTAAKEIGKQIAEKAKAMSIKKVVFDRGRCKYHGIIAELAQSARENGLEF